MEEILESHFQRIEVALQTLIDSITTYNPSPPAAVELVAADDALGEGLEQCLLLHACAPFPIANLLAVAQHQSNHRRILTLRATAAALDTQLKASLTLLADARRELADASISTKDPADGFRDVDFSQLVDYARSISRYTVPPTLRTPLEMPPSKKQSTTKDVKMSNGSTPAAVAAVDSTSPTPAATENVEEHETQPLEEKDKGIGWASLTEDQRRFLDRLSELQFVPWPHDDAVRSGALARIQAMQEQGMNPAAMTKPREDLEMDRQNADDDSRRREEEERTRREAERAGLRPTAGRERPRAAEEEKRESAFAGLDLYDPDEG